VQDYQLGACTGMCIYTLEKAVRPVNPVRVVENEWLARVPYPSSRRQRTVNRLWRFWIKGGKSFGSFLVCSFSPGLRHNHGAFGTHGKGRSACGRFG